MKWTWSCSISYHHRTLAFLNNESNKMLFPPTKYIFPCLLLNFNGICKLQISTSLYCLRKAVFFIDVNSEKSQLCRGFTWLKLSTQQGHSHSGTLLLLQAQLTSLPVTFLNLMIIKRNNPRFTLIPSFSETICGLFSFFFLCDAHGMWSFPGWGWNPRHSSDPSHSSDNARSLTREPPGNSHLWFFICV